MTRKEMLQLISEIENDPKRDFRDPPSPLEIAMRVQAAVLEEAARECCLQCAADVRALAERAKS